MDVLEAIQSRFSTRQFLDKAVSQDTLVQLLQYARQAPSAVNTQPWQVHVVTGAKKDAISRSILEARASGIKENPDYHYYPGEWFEPYKTRRKTCGKALYSALDIGYDDTDKRIAAWNRNYAFFGAPVGLFLFIDARLAKGSWMDIGMFLQTLMIAARAFDLGTCPQAAMAENPDIVREHLGIEADLHLVCGIALGYPDMQAPINQYRTEREAVDTFTTWHE